MMICSNLPLPFILGLAPEEHLRVGGGGGGGGGCNFESFFNYFFYLQIAAKG